MRLDCHQEFPRPSGSAVACIFLVYDSYSPNLPATTHDCCYTRSGGVLYLDGQRVNPDDGPALFVNGPYGYTVRLATTEREIAALMNGTQGAIRPRLLYWQNHIEPRLYKLTGSCVGQLRDGLWTYRLADNTLYMDATYRLGQRHGDWTTYYPNGNVQTRQQFDAGKPSGCWSYFDEQGNLLGSLEWENGFIQKKGNERFIQGGGSGSSFIARDGVKSGSFLSDRDGGKFFLEGKPVPRPRLDPLLLITKE